MYPSIHVVEEVRRAGVVWLAMIHTGRSVSGHVVSSLICVDEALNGAFPTEM